MIGMLLRLGWRWKFRADRRRAERWPLTVDLQRWAYAKRGHLNTATGQRADVIWSRMTPEQRKVWEEKW